MSQLNTLIYLYFYGVLLSEIYDNVLVKCHKRIKYYSQ